MDEAGVKLYDMIIAISKPMALKSAVLLRIPDIIATYGYDYGDGYWETCKSLSVKEIASHISPPPSKTDALSRILRFLASNGVFSESRDYSRYGLNPISKLLMQEEENIKNHSNMSWAPYILLVTDKVFMAPWQRLHESVSEDCSPWTREYGMNIWEYASQNPQSSKTFNQAMASHSNAVMPYVVEKYQGFKDLKTLVDVGGGVGSCLSAILAKHSHIHAINFDLPHVVATAPAISGVEHIGGDMFEAIPAADAIFLKCILHDWDDEKSVALLKKCHEAIPRNGKVIIVEIILDGRELRPLKLSLDMAMVLVNPGGRERSEEEFKALFDEAGFKSYSIIPLPTLLSIIELSKA